MYEFSKQILLKVSFDRSLFKKELSKVINWVKTDEKLMLKAWCLATFVQYQDVILDTFEQIN